MAFLTKKQKTSSKAQNTIPMKKRKLDAFPDRIDFRDWSYQPALISLPDEVVNCGVTPVPGVGPLRRRAERVVKTVRASFFYGPVRKSRHATESEG
jgi:hypothetical protein